MHFLAFNILGRRIKAIPRMLRDKTVPKRKKALIVFGIVYLLLPFDIIPTVLFPVGFIDDLILWIWIIWYLREELDRYAGNEKREDLSRKYRGKTIIRDVEFEIKDDVGKAGK